MPSMLSRRWHIFPPKKPVFEGWAACASGEWSSYQFRRDLDAPPSLPPPSSGNLTDVRVLACYPSGSAPGGSGASRGAHVPRGPCPEADGRRTGSGSRPPSLCCVRAAPAREPSRAARRSRSGRRACAEPTGPVNVHYAGMARPARFGLATYRAPTAVVPTRDTARPPV